MSRPLVAVTVAIAVAVLSLGCSKPPEKPAEATGASPAGHALEEIATSQHQWAGVAVAHDGEIFVGFPRWSADVPTSLARLDPGKTPDLTPVPDAAWNAWQPGADPSHAWVCVQGTWVDRNGSLWVVDSASPSFAGVVPGGAKLVEIDPRTLEVKRVIPFGDDVAPAKSYLNDVRVDDAANVAYLTDSGLGAIVVVDLATNTARRVLAGDPSTQSEGLVLRFDGKEFRMPDGSLPQIHSDGIALDPDGTHLLFHPLTGLTLHRVETAALRDATLSPEALAAKVETVTKTAACDGMETGFDGTLYVTALQERAIQRVAADGTVDVLVQDDRLQWPDTFALRSDGWLYVTTSQIHRGFGGTPPEPYRLMRVRVP